MTNAMPFSYAHRSVTQADGARDDVFVTRFPAHSLRFATVTQTGPRARLRDTSHLRRYMALARGETVPVIIAWACLDDDVPAGALFPDADAVSEAGEHVLSANSWITCVLRALVSRGELRWQAGAWHVATRDSSPDWRGTAQQVVSWLVREHRLWLETGPGAPRPAAPNLDGFDPVRHLVPVGRCGFVRDYAAGERPRAAFNTAFFLLEQDDCVSHHSALGEAHGLSVEAGTITRPPLYRRAAIWHTPAHGWRTGPFDMNDVTVELPGGTVVTPSPAHDGAGLPFRLNPADAQAVALYTRAWGAAQHGRVLGHTPQSPGRFEITVVDTRLVGWKSGGGLLIPQNGFVLSFAASTLSPGQAARMQRFGHVRYGFARSAHQAIDHAMQCGPQLIRDGTIVLNPSSLDDEDFWVSRWLDGQYVVGVVPSDYPDDVDRTRAGRIGLGIDRDSDLLVVAVPGISKHVTQTAGDSVGATLAELAEIMAAEGAVDAINLDGGGSTQLFVDGGLFARQGDRRGYDGVVFDRMVPGIGAVSAAE